MMCEQKQRMGSPNEGEPHWGKSLTDVQIYFESDRRLEGESSRFDSDTCRPCLRNSSRKHDRP